MDIKEVEILGNDIERHWYYKSKASALQSLLHNLTALRVLDVGAGSGFFSRSLLRSGTASTALCIDTAYAADHDEVEAGRPIHFRKSGSAKGVDLLLMMDVLEHVDDDFALLRKYVEQLDPGATVVISVPAFQWLWSPHDDFLEHRRRYDLPEVESLMRRAGLEVVQSSYYFAGVFPIAAILRIPAQWRRQPKRPASDLRRHGLIVNTLLSMLCRLELSIFKHNRIAGLTVFGVGKRPL